MKGGSGEPRELPSWQGIEEGSIENDDSGRVGCRPGTLEAESQVRSFLEKSRFKVVRSD